MGGRVAADAGPATRPLAMPMALVRLRNSGLTMRGQQLFEAGAGDGDILRLAGSDLSGALAQDAGDGALQIADAGLAGVAVDDAVEGALGEGDLAGQAAGIQLQGPDASGRCCTFPPGCSWAARWRRRGHAQYSRGIAHSGVRGDEEAWLKSNRHIDEKWSLKVLFCSGSGASQAAAGVTWKSPASLSIVQKHQGVRALGRDRSVDDFAGHRADGVQQWPRISRPHPHAAEADADMLTCSSGSRRWAGDAGLTDTGRSADEQMSGPSHRGARLCGRPAPRGCGP